MIFTIIELLSKFPIHLSFMGAQWRVQTGHLKLSFFVFLCLFLYSFCTSCCQKLYICITVFQLNFSFICFFIHSVLPVVKRYIYFVLLCSIFFSNLSFFSILSNLFCYFIVVFFSANLNTFCW